MEKGVLFATGCALCLSATLRSAPATAQYQVFQTSWEEAAWQVQTRPQRCVLQQGITHFGQVRFEQQPGRALALSLSTELKTGRLDRVRVVSQPPPWKHGFAARVLGAFAPRADAAPVVLPAAQTLQVYRALESGMQTMIELVPENRPDAAARVILSPLRFLQVLPEFIACADGLPQLDFTVLESENIYFSHNSFNLDAAARRTLAEVTRRWRQRKDMRVVLGGFADGTGQAAYNLRLSRKRAESVARYLRWRGVPRTAIEMRHFGAAGAGDLAQEANAPRSRRVTLWLTAAQ